MKPESTIGADVAGLVIGGVLSALLYVPYTVTFVVVRNGLPPDTPLITHAINIAWGALGIAALLGVTLPAHRMQLRSLVGGALLMGIGVATFFLCITGGNYGNHPRPYSQDALRFTIAVFPQFAIGGVTSLAASFLAGVVTAWAGRGLLSLVKRQSRQGQQAASREREASVPAQAASAWGTAKEGVRPAAEEVAITRH